MRSPTSTRRSSASTTSRRGRRGASGPSYMEAGPFEMYSPDEVAFQKRLRLRPAHPERHHHGAADRLALLPGVGRDLRRVRADRRHRAQTSGSARISARPIAPATPSCVQTGAWTTTSTRRAASGPRRRGPLRRRPSRARTAAWSAPCWRRTASRPARPSCSGARRPPAGISACRFGCIAASRASSTTRVLARHGMSPPEWLAQPRLPVDARPPAARHLRVREQPRRARPGAISTSSATPAPTIVHCPLVSAPGRQRDRVLPAATARWASSIGLGTDTYPPDMILNMQVGIDALPRASSGDASAVPRPRTTTTPRRSAAPMRSAGRDLGRLAPGARADITVFDLSDPHSGQVIDPIQTMMLDGSGRDFSHRRSSTAASSWRTCRIPGVDDGGARRARAGAVRRPGRALPATHPRPSAGRGHLLLHLSGSQSRAPMTAPRSLQRPRPPGRVPDPARPAHGDGRRLVRHRPRRDSRRGRRIRGGQVAHRRRRSSGCSSRRAGSPAARSASMAGASTTCRRRGCGASAARQIGAIFQDPLTSLNPLLTVGQQLVETIRTHLALTAAAARARALELLGEVGIPAAETRIDHYPHQFSGGMRQRVVIALALARRAEADHRRRADDRARRLDPGADHRPAEAALPRARHRGHAGHPRHGRDRRDRRPRRGHVCRPHRRDRSGARRDPPAAASLYGRPDGLDPERRASTCARLGQIDGAMPRLGRDPARLRVSPALPACVRSLPVRAARRSSQVGVIAGRLLAAPRSRPMA